MRHVLHTSAGFIVEMFLDELSGQIRCEWSPHPPRTASQLRRVIREYEPWRNEVVSEWSQRSGKKVMMVNGAAGEHVETLTVIDGAKITTEPWNHESVQ